MGQARINPPIIVTRFDFTGYTVPPAIREAARPPYQLLRDLVVIEHPQNALIDKLLMDMVSGAHAAPPPPPRPGTASAT